MQRLNGAQVDEVSLRVCDPSLTPEAKPLNYNPRMKRESHVAPTSPILRCQTGFFRPCCKLLAVALLGASQFVASAVIIYTNDFEAFSNVATNLSDMADTDPVGAEWNMADDNPVGTASGSGVQVINWLAHSGSKSLFLRPGSEAQVNLPNTRSGTNYQFDFWMHVVKAPTGSHSFLVILRGEGADLNADDYIAYRSERVITNSSVIYYFDGIGPELAGWTNTLATHIEATWQHHRMIINPVTQKMMIYIDDMVNPVVTNADLARSEIPVPTQLRIIHEGNTADDGYIAVDDISLTVDGSIDLTTTFTDGFESYPARSTASDDADPRGPWITVEVDGTGQSRALAPPKVQVVDSSVVAPHSGNKCLKLEAGQRAGASVAWGVTPQSDVQITWWARVPSAAANNPSPDAMYLRMSLYGAEGGNTFSGDSALLGYGIRATAPVVGDATSLLFFSTLWVDTTVDYTPDTWEQYQLTTHNAQGRYTIVKNPSGVNPQVIVDRAVFVGTAANWGPSFMAAWSSSNGTNHPPVYIDDIEIKSLTSSAELPANPYTITNFGSRFTNVTVLKVNGSVGKAVVDPRDNTSILFNLDTEAGAIYRAQKIASGNWRVDSQPIVTGLDRPSGLVVSTNGTIWWTHDFTQSIRRLKAPWESNVVEEVVTYFGDSAIDDDPIDLTIAPDSFTGSPGQPGVVVIADRGSDGDAFNSLNLLDPNTTALGQTNSTFLVAPTGSGIGGGNLNVITPIAQYGEVATLTTDGFIAAVNGSGAVRQIVPTLLWSDIFSGGPAPAGTGMAADPTTGRLWIADDTRDEVWSVDANPNAQTPDQKELAFPLTDTARPDLQMDFHDPGLAFAPNGSFLIVQDTSVVNGGGRLLIFHNEPIVVTPFPITSAAKVGQGFQLTWQSAGAATYRVQRGTNVNSLVDITGDLSVTTFTDTNVLSRAFYRVVAKP